MATRRALMVLAKNPSIVLHQMGGSRGYHPMRRVSGEINLQPGQTSAALPPGPPISSSLTLQRITDTSPFRPSTGTGQISTLKPTAASQLSEALEEVSVPSDSEDKMDVNEVENDLSVVDPKKRSTISIEDAQRSLSGEESGAEQSLLQDSRRMSSVSFASHAQVVSVLATPQIPAGGQRFLVADAETKDTDGKAGSQSVRRKAHQVLSRICCNIL